MKSTYSLNRLPQKSSLRRKVFYGAILAMVPLLLIFEKAFAQTPQTKLYLVGRYYANPTRLINYRNGSPMDVDLIVSDITDSDGLAAFTMKLSYDPQIVFIADSDNDGIADPQAVRTWNWLGMWGKQQVCSNGYIGPDETNPAKNQLTLTCLTLGTTRAPTGTGMLATIKFTPRDNLGATSLTLSSTELADNTQDANLIPHTTAGALISIMRCADFDGDGVVTVPGDILPVILHYNTAPSSPNWDPKYDLNGDGMIDVINDIMPAIMQYLMACQRT